MDEFEIFPAFLKPFLELRFYDLARDNPFLMSYALKLAHCWENNITESCVGKSWKSAWIPHIINTPYSNFSCLYWIGSNITKKIENAVKELGPNC